MPNLIRRHFQALAALAIRGGSVLAGFAISFAIGRTLGPEANGQYALITQTGMFLSVLAVGGLDLAATRRFSAAVARKVPVALGSLFKAIGWSMSFALVIVVVLVVGGAPLADRLLTEHRPAGALIFLALILISRALTRMLSAVLRSQRAFMLGQAVEVLVIPTVVITLIVAGIAHSVVAILWATALTGLATGVFAIFACLRYTSTSASALHVPMRDLMSSALPLWGVAIALNVADWYGLAVAAHLLGIADAGLFRVASQVGGALTIVGLGLFSVYSPQIGAAHAKDDRREIAMLTRTATRLSVVFVLPAAAVLVVAAEPILALFGPAFVPAANALRVFTIGQAVYAMTGPAGITLAMTGHERVNFAITVTGTLALFVMAPVGAYFGGLTGLSAGLVIALVGRNIASLIAVDRLLGINVATGAIRMRPGGSSA